MEFNWPLFWYLLEGFKLLRHFIFLVTRAVVHKRMETSSINGTTVDKPFPADSSITQFPVQTSSYQEAKSPIPQDASPSWISKAQKCGFEVQERMKSLRKGFLNAMEKIRSAEHKSSFGEVMSSCTFNGYIGLLNEGNTCFLNSLLQCLYLTPEFRDKIYLGIRRLDFLSPEEEHLRLSEWENNRGKTLLAVEKIFNALEERQYVTTRELTACLRLEPVKQQDVPEVFLLLLNKLDEELSNGSYFKELYESTMVSLTECTQCKTKDGLDMGCNIVILPLPVSSVRSGEKRWSVTDALEHFLRSSEMKGENQIYCSNCSEKTDATLRQALTSLPRILVVQLKRFEFSFYEQKFVKLENEMHINTTLEVPCEKTSQKDKMSYDLFAICDHYGGFKSGHYTALISPEENGKWFRFNDSTVTSEEISDPENRNSLLDNSSWNKYDLSRSRTAYVLMYRQRMEREPQKSEDAPVHADLRAPQSRVFAMTPIVAKIM